MQWAKPWHHRDACQPHENAPRSTHLPVRHVLHDGLLAEKRRTLTAHNVAILLGHEQRNQMNTAPSTLARELAGTSAQARRVGTHRFSMFVWPMRKKPKALTPIVAKIKNTPLGPRTGKLRL